MSKKTFKSMADQALDHSSGVVLSQRAMSWASLALLAMFTLPVVGHSKSTENLSLSNALEKVKTFQATQGVWETQAQIANANKKQAKLWINPNLSIEQSGFKNDQDKELTIGISQRLDLFGERKAQQKLAEISSNQVALKQQIYQAQLELVVKYLWSQLAILELERDVVLEQLKNSQENLQATEKRYQAGNIAQVDVDRIRINTLENERLFKQAELELKVAQQNLSQLWGESSSLLSIDQNPKNLWPFDSISNVERFQKDNLLEKSLQLQILESKTNIDVLKAEARPNPTLNAGIKRTSSPDSATENQVLLGVEIPLNIFNRNQYGVEISQAKQQLLDRQQQFYRSQNKTKVSHLLSELNDLSSQFQQLQNIQIPLALRVQQKTLQGFQAGKFAVTDVQQATMQLQDVRLRRVQLLKTAWQRAITAESLSLGVSPEQIMAADALDQLNQNAWQDTQNLPVIGGGK
nr:TolC family protein [Acinetobacter gerneri]